MGLLAGKTAIITGGGQGIGEGICKNFAREGARVAVLGRTLSKVERVAKEIQSEGGEAFAVQCDVTDQAAVDHAISEIAAKYGGIDILVNNAMTQRLCPVEQATAEDLMDTLRSCVLGSFLMSMACFPYLKASKGKVVNFGSCAGTEGRPNMLTYGTAKAACQGFTRNLAVEWGPYGINVNCVVPTADSPAYKEHVKRVGQEVANRAFDMYIIKRMCDPETDVANIVLFLCSHLSNYMSGRTLYADGGRSLTR